MLIREATGGATPGPHDRVREDELAVVPFIEIEPRWPACFDRAHPPGAVRQLAPRRSNRVGCLAVRPVRLHALPGGATAIELGARASSPETVTLDEATNEAVLAIWQSRQVQAWTANIIGGFRGGPGRCRIVEDLHRPPAICFLDITGYTRLTYERGDEAAADLAERLGRLRHRSSR